MDTSIETAAYTPEESQLAALYGMTVEQMRETLAAAKLYPDLECDENGMPLGCTLEQWFDELDKKLIAHFGEDFRVLANARRRKWNQRDNCQFDLL